MLIEPRSYVRDVGVLDPTNVTRLLCLGLSFADEKFEPFSVGMRGVHGRQKRLLHLQAPRCAFVRRENGSKPCQRIHEGIGGEILRRPNDRHVSASQSLMKKRILSQMLVIFVGLLPVEHGDGRSVAANEPSMLRYGVRRRLFMNPLRRFIAAGRNYGIDSLE